MDKLWCSSLLKYSNTWTDVVVVQVSIAFKKKKLLCIASGTEE